MNVSSSTPWLSNFHKVRFPGSSDCFFVFKFVVVLLLVVRGGTVCLPMPPSWPEVHTGPHHLAVALTEALQMFCLTWIVTVIT